MIWLLSGHGTQSGSWCHTRTCLLLLLTAPTPSELRGSTLEVHVIFMHVIPRVPSWQSIVQQFTENGWFMCIGYDCGKGSSQEIQSMAYLRAMRN